MKKKNVITIAGVIFLVAILAIVVISITGKDNNITSNNQPANSDSTGINSSSQIELPWIPLAELNNYQDILRVPVEEIFYIKVNPSTGEKEGYFYRDNLGNTIHDNSLKTVLTSNSLVAQMLDHENTLNKLAEIAYNTYKDIDDTNSYAAAMLALNAYFNILPDDKPSYATPNRKISRAEFMTMVFRADNTVDKNLTVNKDFEALVGKSEYNLFAQGLADKTYISITDKSLNEKTYIEPISRAEAIYYFISTYFTYELENFDPPRVELNDVTAEELPANLYKTLVLAQYKGFIDSDTRWNEDLTKAEAVELMFKIYSYSGIAHSDDISEDNRYYFDEYGRLDCGYTDEFTYQDDIEDGVMGFELCYNPDGTTYLKYNKDGSEYHLMDTLPNGVIYTGQTEADSDALKAMGF